eukprot:jgi/Mesvir1/5553/Mv15581-RA.4
MGCAQLVQSPWLVRGSALPCSCACMSEVPTCSTMPDRGDLNENDGLPSSKLQPTSACHLQCMTAVRREAIPTGSGSASLTSDDHHQRTGPPSWSCRGAHGTPRALHVDALGRSRDLETLSQPFPLFHFDLSSPEGCAPPQPDSCRLSRLVPLTSTGSVDALVTWWTLELDAAGDILYSTAPAWASVTADEGSPLSPAVASPSSATKQVEGIPKTADPSPSLASADASTIPSADARIIPKSLKALAVSEPSGVYHTGVHYTPHDATDGGDAASHEVDGAAMMVPASTGKPIPCSDAHEGGLLPAMRSQGAPPRRQWADHWRQCVYTLPSAPCRLGEGSSEPVRSHEGEGVFVGHPHIGGHENSAALERVPRGTVPMESCVHVVEKQEAAAGTGPPGGRSDLGRPTGTDRSVDYTAVVHDDDDDAAMGGTAGGVASVGADTRMCQNSGGAAPADDCGNISCIDSGSGIPHPRETGQAAAGAAAAAAVVGACGCWHLPLDRPRLRTGDAVLVSLGRDDMGIWVEGVVAVQQEIAEASRSQLAGGNETTSRGGVGGLAGVIPGGFVAGDVAVASQDAADLLACEDTHAKADGGGRCDGETRGTGQGGAGEGGQGVGLEDQEMERRTMDTFGGRARAGGGMREGMEVGRCGESGTWQAGVPLQMQAIALRGTPYPPQSTQPAQPQSAPTRPHCGCLVHDLLSPNRLAALHDAGARETLARWVASTLHTPSGASSPVTRQPSPPTPANIVITGDSLLLPLLVRACLDAHRVNPHGANASTSGIPATEGEGEPVPPPPVTMLASLGVATLLRRVLRNLSLSPHNRAWTCLVNHGPCADVSERDPSTLTSSVQERSMKGPMRAGEQARGQAGMGREAGSQGEAFRVLSPGMGELRGGSMPAESYASYCLNANKLVDVVLSEPFYRPLEEHLPWDTAIHFWYERTALQPALAPFARVVPAGAVLMAAAVSAPDLHRSRQPLRQVEGFDLSLANRLLGGLPEPSLDTCPHRHDDYDTSHRSNSLGDDQAERGCQGACSRFGCPGWKAVVAGKSFPVQLWQCGEGIQLLSEPRPLLTFDFTGAMRQLHGCAELPIVRAGACHGLVLWMDYHGAPSSLPPPSPSCTARSPACPGSGYSECGARSHATSHARSYGGSAAPGHAASHGERAAASHRTAPDLPTDSHDEGPSPSMPSHHSGPTISCSEGGRAAGGHGTMATAGMPEGILSQSPFSGNGAVNRSPWWQAVKVFHEVVWLDKPQQHRRGHTSMCTPACWTSERGPVDPSVRGTSHSLQHGQPTTDKTTSPTGHHAKSCQISSSGDMANQGSRLVVRALMDVEEAGVRLECAHK